LSDRTVCAIGCNYDARADDGSLGGHARVVVVPFERHDGLPLTHGHSRPLHVLEQPMIEHLAACDAQHRVAMKGALIVAVRLLDQRRLFERQLGARGDRGTRGRPCARLF
jgi:hypothetical protein